MIEFALVGPIFVLLVIGILEMSILFLTHTTLEGAVTEAARTGITGGSSSGLSREATIRAAVDRIGGALIDPSLVSLDMLVYPTFDSVGKPEPFTDLNGDGLHQVSEPFSDINGNGAWDADMGLSGAGGANDIVLYRASFAWQPITPLLGGLLPNDGAITLSAAIAVRNEPYE